MRSNGSLGRAVEEKACGRRGVGRREKGLREVRSQEEVEEEVEEAEVAGLVCSFWTEGLVGEFGRVVSVLRSRVRSCSDASAQKSFGPKCAPVSQPSWFHPVAGASRRPLVRSRQDLCRPTDLTRSHRNGSGHRGVVMFPTPKSTWPKTQPERMSLKNGAEPGQAVPCQGVMALLVGSWRRRSLAKYLQCRPHLLKI